MTLRSSAELRLLNGLLQVSSVSLPLFPIFNCAQLQHYREDKKQPGNSIVRR
jgi:hypothetical protein